MVKYLVGKWNDGAISELHSGRRGRNESYLAVSDKEPNKVFLYNGLKESEAEVLQATELNPERNDIDAFIKVINEKGRALFAADAKTKVKPTFVG